MNTNPVVTKFTGDAKPFFAELDKVRNELGGFRGDVARISGQVGNLLKGYLGFQAITGTIRAVINATAESEAAQAALNNALSRSVKDVRAASAEFQAYATQLQKTTTFGDEAIIQVETLLLSFQGLSGHVIKDATQAVLDLSTRMGIDAPAAAKLLGKALADPEKGMSQLARAGVIFTDQQKAQIKALTDAGKAAEAQGLILKTLEKNFGGAAAAARDTFGGALTGLKNAVGDLLEGKGGINAAADSINHLTQVLQDPAIINGISKLIEGLAKAISLAAQLAAGLAIVFTGKGGNESVDIDLQIEKLQKQKAALERGATLGETIGPTMEFYTEDQFKADQARIKAIDAQIEVLLARQRALLGLGKEGAEAAAAKKATPAPTTLDFTTGGEAPEAAVPTFDSARFVEEMKVREQIEQEAAARRLEILQGEQQARLALEQQLQERLGEIDNGVLDRVAETMQQRLQMEEDLNASILSLRQNAVDQGVALLQVFAQRSKTAAKALILVNKALSIAQVVQNTAAAAAKALAIYGPTPAGFAAAAAAKTFGAIQIGLITATGALEISSVGKGGAASVVGPGTPNNPIFTRDEDSQQRGVTSNPSISVTVTGVVTSSVVEQLVDGLKDFVNGRDGIIINSNSRQALELRGT